MTFKVGDLININKPAPNEVWALVIEVWDFQKYCAEADRLSLEIDIDDAWENWKERGPLLVVLHPERTEPQKVWSGHEK